MLLEITEKLNDNIYKNQDLRYFHSQIDASFQALSLTELPLPNE